MTDREMILKVALSLLIFSLLEDMTIAGDQCLSNLKNIAVRVGQPNTIMNLYINPLNVSWKVRPTSNESTTYDIIYIGGARDPSLTNLYDVNQTGLVIKDATTTENGNPISTAGMYIGQCANNTNRTGAKLLVIHTGLQCSCTASNYASNVSCNVTYADSTYHPIYAIVTWKLNGVFLASYTLPRTRFDPNVFYAESTITYISGDPGIYTCELTFAPPTDIQFQYIARNAPEFNESCSTPVCGGALSTTEHSATILSPTTTTSSIGYCLLNMKNIAVREGTLDVLMNVTASRCAAWLMSVPTSDVITIHQITNYDCTVDPTLAELYYVNGSGLIIRNSTTTENGQPLSTAGLYEAHCSIENTTMSAKLLVVRSGPVCLCIPDSSSSNVQLSCSVVFADHMNHPIPAIMTWIINGAVYTTDEPYKNKTDGYVYNATSTITVDGSVVNSYQCILTFGESTDYQYDWIATNAPEFNESCSTPVCAGTTSTTKSSTVAPSSTRPTTAMPSTTGRYSIGSLTRKPTNTAAVAGSNDIALGCASSYGTDEISWSFTALGSFSNQTIWISNGYKLLDTNQQQYGLLATVNSSVLFIRQLSSLTEGTYGCYDGVESASALLLVIPLQISVEPLFGPIAGGTNITIIGSVPIEYLSRYVGSYKPNTIGVREVYFGNDLSSTSVLLKPNVSSTFELVAVTPNTSEASIEQPLPIIIEFSPTLFNMTFNKAFTYLPNPDITGMLPDQFIVNGGTLLDVFGRSLSSVAKPIIQLKVVITRSADNSSTSTTSSTSTSRVCTVPSGNDTYMQCPMPPLNLSNDFLEMLNLQYNTNTIRSKRDIKPSNANVLTVVGRNGVDRADIYLGFILDGYREYENINDALPDTKFIFYSAPEINSSNEVIEFDWFEDELIYVKGGHMLRGCRLKDYVVHIGNQICINNDLQDNQLSCRPPNEKPSSTANDAIYCDQHLSITITVGYKQYQYACLTYTDYSAAKAFDLIVGLTVGLSGFALFLTILIVGILSCRRKKESLETEERQDSQMQEFRTQHYRSHLNITEELEPHDENSGRQEFRNQHHPSHFNNAPSYEQESHQDYANMGQQNDDDKWPNKGYLKAFDEFGSSC